MQKREDGPAEGEREEWTGRCQLAILEGDIRHRPRQTGDMTAVKMFVICNLLA